MQIVIKIKMGKLFRYSIAVLFALTFLSCTKEGDAGSNFTSSTGKGGSLARFTILGNRLYVVDHIYLKTYDISTPGSMTLLYSSMVGGGVETIYPYKDKLFIGSRDGMYIYNTFENAAPELLGTARHTRSCDPVVANDNTAFVTLRGGQPCGTAEDGLYIYNIQNLLNPQLVKTQLMPTPHGLGLQDSILYVCQKNNGMSVFNVQNPANPVLRKTISNRIFEDVICYNDVLITYVSNGIALYDISQPANPIEIAAIIN